MPSLHLGLAQVRHVADGRGHASQCPMAALIMYQLFSMSSQASRNSKSDVSFVGSASDNRFIDGGSS